MRNLVDCKGQTARIGPVLKSVPKNHDCIISGFHFINGKMMKEGTFRFVPKPEPGPTKYVFSGDNTIEYK